MHAVAVQPTLQCHAPVCVQKLLAKHVRMPKHGMRVLHACNSMLDLPCSATPLMSLPFCSRLKAPRVSS